MKLHPFIPTRLIWAAARFPLLVSSALLFGDAQAQTSVFTHCKDPRTPCARYTPRAIIDCYCDTQIIVLKALGRPVLQGSTKRNWRFSETVPLSWRGVPTSQLNLQTTDPALAKALAAGYTINSVRTQKNGDLVMNITFHK